MHRLFSALLLMVAPATSFAATPSFSWIDHLGQVTVNLTSSADEFRFIIYMSDVGATQHRAIVNWTDLTNSSNAGTYIGPITSNIFRKCLVLAGGGDDVIQVVTREAFNLQGIDAQINGSSGNDTLTIFGESKDMDHCVAGGGGNDTLCITDQAISATDHSAETLNGEYLGGAGDDFMIAGGGSDYFNGYDGNDTVLYCNDGTDTLTGIETTLSNCP